MDDRWHSEPSWALEVESAEAKCTVEGGSSGKAVDEKESVALEKSISLCMLSIRNMAHICASSILSRIYSGASKANVVS
jgi:hypothetical protein